MEIISREEAASQGKKRYFTGQPCRNGHVAQRYVLNSGCLDCAHRFKRLRAVNSFSHDLVPFDAVTFWRSKRHTQESLKGLHAYIQGCIKHYDDLTLGPVCDLCTGSYRIPRKVPMGIEWLPCPKCGPTSGIEFYGRTTPDISGKEFAPGSPAPPLR